MVLQYGVYIQTLSLVINHRHAEKIIKDIFTLWIVSWIWLDPCRWNWLWNSNTCCLSYTANTMLADALATLGASASAGMVTSWPQKPEYSISTNRRVNPPSTLFEAAQKKYICIFYDECWGIANNWNPSSWPLYPTLSIAYLLMSWLCMQPGHQQLWYWPSHPIVFWVQHQKG